DPGAVEALPARDVLEGPLLAGGERTIEARDHEVGRALEDVQPGGPLRELRDELERARRVADHRDALAGDVEIVVPARRVPGRALVRGEPREVGNVGAVELPERAHQHVGLELLAGAGAQAPAAL